MNTAQQVIIVVIIATLLFKAIALAEILRNEFKGNHKLMWVLIVLLMPLVGWLFYFLSSSKNIVEKEEEPIKPTESVVVSNIAINQMDDLYYFIYNGTEYYYEDFHAAENSIQTIAATGNVSVRNLIKSKPA